MNTDDHIEVKKIAKATPSEIPFSVPEVAIAVAVGSVIVVALLYILPHYQAYRTRTLSSYALQEAKDIVKLEKLKAAGELEAAEIRAESMRILSEAAARYPHYTQIKLNDSLCEALELGKIKNVSLSPSLSSSPTKGE